MNKKVIIIVLAVAIAVAGYFVYDLKFKDRGGEDAQETSLEDIYYYSAGDYFVTNVLNSKGLSKISVSMAMTGEDQTVLLTNHNALIRSVIVEVMRSFTEEELRAVDATQRLSAEMMRKLKEALKVEGIVNVYISDFVIQ